MRLWTVALAVLAMLAAGPALAGISVTTTNDADTLTNTIVGTGITVVGTPTYTGAAAASGTFTGGISAGIGIEEGIILTSGDASLAPGPNSSDGSGSSNGAPGDADLTALTGDVTHNASVLEFDFETDGGDLFFNFVFASEEYNEFVDSFNDAFALFLDGVNIALIPGTSTEVSVDTVNNGDHADKYNDNDPSDTATPFDIEYDGFTDVFTATALGIGAGTHTIKMAIADANDTILDSAVFIEGNTFSDEPPDDDIIPEPASVLVWSLLGAVGLMVAWRRRKR